MPDINRPLSEREIEELSAYFASAYAPDDCMPISMLHGFLSRGSLGPGGHRRMSGSRAYGVRRSLALRAKPRCGASSVY